MKMYREEILIETRGEGDLVDITSRISDIVTKSGIRDGLVNIFCPGSTCAISSIEYEPGLKTDLFEILDDIIPRNRQYKHNERWGDNNGHSHVRATLLKPSYTAPVGNGRLMTGIWQQIVFIELDVRPRRRRIIVTVIGLP